MMHLELETVVKLVDDSIESKKLDEAIDFLETLEELLQARREGLEADVRRVIKRSERAETIATEIEDLKRCLMNEVGNIKIRTSPDVK